MVHLRHRNLLQTMVATIFPPFYRHRAAREQYFRRFSACSAPQIHSRTVLAFAGHCERSEMWREPRGDDGGPHAEGKMKSSHPKWNDCFLF